MSEVSSTGMVDEKEQISVPKDLFHDFESLKNVTNLTTVDLMRKLLGEYQTCQSDGIPNDMDSFCLPKMTDSPNSQREEMVKSDDQCQQVLVGTAQSPRPSVQKSVGRLGRKSGIPGQKLKQVCEILHCKRVAKELAEQKRQEHSDRNCNSAGSSSSGTIGCFEETNFESVPPSSYSPFSSIKRQTKQVPLAHTANTQDAVNLRKLLGNRVHKSAGLHSYETKGCNDSNRVAADDTVLDLSVKKYNDTSYVYGYPEGGQAQQISNTMFPHTHTTDMDTAVFGIQNYGSTENVSKTNTMDQPSTGYTYANAGVSVVVTENNHHWTPATGLPSQFSAQYVPAPHSTTVTMAQRAPSTSGSLLDTSRMRTRTRKQIARKPPVNEGMKLINENSLYPGVYTSTFKLPGSRRGRRSTAAKQAAAQLSAAKNSGVSAQNAPGGSHQNAVMPLQEPVGSQQSYMMLCPQVAVSSVLVKTPRKRGRPPKRPNISQLQQALGQPTLPAPVVLPQSQMQISLPGGGAPGFISSDNGAVSYLYKPQTEQSQMTLQNPQSLVNNDTNSGQVHSHAQLMNILNHATSINACNPIFVPNSSLQSGIPTALPTNASGMITLPLQQLQAEGAQLIQPSQANVQAPVFIKQEMSPEIPEMQSHVLHEAQAQPNLDKNFDTNVKEEDTKGVFQEMILSPQALVSVKPKPKLTTAEMIRLNSNFYCGSFKIRPQKPATTSGHGVPLKRGRGRPKLNVFECNRQKETKESQLKMYQELFHCKICNEIVSSVDRFSHQRKHVGVKLRCTTCGVEYQDSRSVDVLAKDDQLAQCSQCRKIFGSDITVKVEGFADAVEEEPDSSVIDTYEDAEENQTLDNLSELTSPDEVPCSDDTCHVCSKICSTAAELARHLEQHPDPSLTCNEDDCLITFRNSSELRRHRKHIHGKGREHICEYDGCDKKFLKNFHLQEHIRVKHFNIKAFKCHWPGCRKEFAGIRHLKVHMLIHKNEKPLKCDFCDYRCRQRNALNWHMRRHTDVSFTGTEDGGSSEDEQDDPEMVIDMSLQEDNCSIEELSPMATERENGEIESEHGSYSEFSPVNDSNIVENDSVEILEAE